MIKTWIVMGLLMISATFSGCATATGIINGTRTAGAGILEGIGEAGNGILIDAELAVSTAKDAMASEDE